MNSQPCPHCHEPHPLGAAFCPTTGRVLQPVQPAAAPPPLTALGSSQPLAPPPPLAPAPLAPMVPAPLAPAAPGAVRHSYPLAIQQASFGTAFGLLMKTLPYAGVRFGISILAALATIVFWVIALAGGAYLGTHVASAIGWIWVIGWLVAFGFIWRLFLRYFLYLLKCGHIAVLTELITKGSIGNGAEGMFAYGKRVVKERFGEVNVLFAVDLLVKGIVHAFNRTLDFIGSLLPIEGVRQLLGVVKAVIYAATTYIDETIFSYGLAREEKNPYASARDGVVYYAQNAKEILKTSAWIVVLDYAFSFVVWLVMLAPAFALSHALPQKMFFVSIAAWVIALLFAGSFRAAFLKPLFLIMVMTKFHVSIRNQPINQEWADRLERLSAKFRQLKDRIVGAPRPSLPPAA